MNTIDIIMMLKDVNNLNNVIITLRVNEEMKQKLDNIALEENRSLNNLISTILMRYLDNLENKKNENKN